MNRREFMARATTLGVTATGAYGLLGVAQPAHAGGHMKSGGTLRMQMEVRALKDPRTYDWTQIAHSTAGYLEYLVEYNNDVASLQTYLKAGALTATQQNTLLMCARVLSGITGMTSLRMM